MEADDKWQDNAGKTTLLYRLKVRRTLEQAKH